MKRETRFKRELVITLNEREAKAINNSLEFSRLDLIQTKELKEVLLMIAKFDNEGQRWN